ncbi:MAG: STAS domain-containing protein [Myxococcaceae bacterium]
MEMQVKEADGVVQVAFVGRLDTPGVDQVETKFTARLVPGGANGVVDLSGVEFVGSLAIRMFISVGRALARKGRKLVLYAPQPLVNQVFESVSLRTILPVASDYASALAAVRA